MQLATFSDADAFLHDVQAVLEDAEAEHSLMLGLALGLRGALPSEGHPVFLASVRDRDGVALAALMTPPYPLVLATPRADATAATGVLAEELARTATAITRFVGPSEVASRFADAWTRTTGQAPTPAMRQRLFSLTEVQEPRVPPGGLRPATADDVEPAARWIAAFEAEILHGITAEQARRTAERRIDRGEIFFWEDAEPRTMVARARPTRNTVAINSVYTPPEWRRRGIATAAVARLSRTLLDEGFSECVLFTDLSNPTSNAIYARIGYRPVRDFTLYDVEPLAPGG